MKTKLKSRSAGLRNCILNMLAKNPDMRYTMEQALSDPWLLEASKLFNPASAAAPTTALAASSTQPLHPSDAPHPFPVASPVSHAQPVLSHAKRSLPQPKAVLIAAAPPGAVPCNALPSEHLLPVEVNLNSSKGQANVSTKVCANASTKSSVKATTKVHGNAPTKSSANAPRQIPVKAPTLICAHAPTKSSANAPPRVPVKAPTKVPTKAPTSLPTTRPSSQTLLSPRKTRAQAKSKSLLPSKQVARGGDVPLKQQTTKAAKVPRQPPNTTFGQPLPKDTGQLQLYLCQIISASMVLEFFCPCWVKHADK